MIQNPALEIDYKEFVWCLHCKRALRAQAWEENDWQCPTDGCSGDAIDALSWEDRRQWQPKLPETPIDGCEYPQIYD